MTLRLKVGFSNNPRIQPLMDGTVKPRDIALDFVTCNPGELFYRNLKFDEFDVSEFSISSILLVKERSDGTRWNWSPLPVFLSKAFGWLDLWVSNASGIRTLADLKGKRVGVWEYSVTASLWFRAVLKELYGIEPQDIIWYNGRTREMSHGGSLGLDEDPPPGITINWLTQGQSLDAMLDRGELDAAYGLTTSHKGPDSLRITLVGNTPLAGNPRIRRLFVDGGKEVIGEYYRRTGIIPVNHCVIIQNQLIEEHPWVPLELYKAFQEAKAVAYERARKYSSGYLLFPNEVFQEQAAIFGDDPYPLGIEGNRRMLEVLFDRSLADGLIRTPAAIEDVFCPSLLDT